MKITIGSATMESMERLGIKSYPFTSRELSSAFRIKLKEVHPDTNIGGEKKHNEETIKVLQAYKNLKNLAVDPEETMTQVKEEIMEDIDIFKLFETCPHCYGLRTATYRIGGGYCPDCSPRFGFSFWNNYGGVGRGYNYKECDKCNGTGKYLDKGICFKCNGTGKIKARCQTCKGTGFQEAKTITKPCLTCKGKGKIEIDPWNPVIPKGAVLGKNIEKIV